VKTSVSWGKQLHVEKAYSRPSTTASKIRHDDVLHSKTWRTLPPFSPTLPAPDAELFKEFSLCGHGSRMCDDVAKLPTRGELVVSNSLIR
jgi:hypothetical protein